MPEARRTVVVTRPIAQARPLAMRLHEAGHAVEVYPLLDILPLHDDGALRTALARLGEYALVAFVSPNAIDAAFERIGSWPVQVPVAVVGQGSRDALARHGVREPGHTIHFPDDPEQTDSTTLVRALDLDALRGKRVLIVRGDGGREYLGDALRGAGAEVEQVAAYRRAAPAASPARAALLRRLLDGSALWIVTSSEALRVALDEARALGGAELVAKLQQQPLLVPHVRIADNAASLGFTRVARCASGDDAVLAALQ